MRIGIPREIRAGETRVASTPEVVKRLVKTGFDVWVEVGAGVSAHYPNIQYEEAGARLVARAEALAADILLTLTHPASPAAKTNTTAVNPWDGQNAAKPIGPNASARLSDP